MIKVKKKKFGKIWGFEIGYSLINKPIKTVHIYSIDHIWIDTGQSKASSIIPKLVQATKPHSAYLTHYHEDHTGNVKLLNEKLKIPVYGNKQTAKILEKGFNILPYENLMFGAAESTKIKTVKDKFSTDQYEFEIISTPGHSKDHQCFYEKNQGWLFSGDAFVAEKIKYFRREENIYEQIKSLEKLVSLDFELLLCAHFPRKTNAKKALVNKLDYFCNVYNEVENLWNQGLDSKQIMKKLSIKEKIFIKYATFGDVSAEYLIKSAIASIKRGKTLR